MITTWLLNSITNSQLYLIKIYLLVQIINPIIIYYIDKKKVLLQKT
mgnify:CR=1 FL=1|jgi:hypothetical protein